MIMSGAAGAVPTIKMTPARRRCFVMLTIFAFIVCSLRSNQHTADSHIRGFFNARDAQHL